MLSGAELYRAAADGLVSHRLRSGLTALGVIFGVAAVIGMASIGEGAKREALRQIETMGAANLIIDVDLPAEGEERTQALDKNPNGLTLYDAEAIEQLLPGNGAAVPMRIEERKVKGGGVTAKLNIVAAPPVQFQVFNQRTSSGRLLTSLDETDFRRVCLLGWGARRELFPLVDPLGQTVIVDNHPYVVVGIIAQQLSGGEAIQGLDIRDQNMDMYLPLNTWLKRHTDPGSESELTRIVVKTPDTDKLGQYAQLIDRQLLRRHRNIKDFKVVVPELLLKQHQETQRIFNIVMGTIASISLLVGGIGIMNIMLASVLERTKEIGIRRAVGATQVDIARQFLTEAIMLSVAGGAIGVIFGIVLSKVISVYAEWETAVSLWAVLIAVTVSVGVGIIFGWLPAKRAARMDPIVALREE